MNVVAHNLEAMNTNRQLHMITVSNQKNMQRLSSGYRINQSSDDAAGLAISEKMRRQIRGLTRGVTNVGEGIDLCKIADGALAEVTDTLQRMSKLSVQAANGTNANSDRRNIQDEISQLETEVVRVSESTKYGESIYLFKDSAGHEAYDQLNVSYSPVIGSGSYTFTNTESTDIQYGGRNYAPGEIITANYLENFDSATGAYSIVLNGASTVITPTATDTLTEAEDFANKMNSFLMNAIRGGAEVSDLNHSDLYYDKKGNVFFKQVYGTQTDENGGTESLYNNVYLATTGANGEGNLVTKYTSMQEGISYVKADVSVEHVGADTGFACDGIWIQAGSENGSGMMLQFDVMNVDTLGIRGLNVTNVSGAKSSIGRISDAINVISAQRSLIGAQQNRLEHTYNNETNIVENTTAAESRIRDTDMAKEMMVFANGNILAQAGQSMLSQANQANENVLELLRG